MATDEALRAAADALQESVLVAGVGTRGIEAAGRIAAGDAPATDEAVDPDAVVLAVDGTDPETGAATDAAASSAAASLADSVPTTVDAPVCVAVVTVLDGPTTGERALLAALQEHVDAVVLTAGEGTEALVEGVEAFVSVVRDPGFVNVDLADARTVLDPIDLAGLGLGASASGSADEAVGRAFSSLPSGVETDPASGVLVDLHGGLGLSVGDVDDAVTAVRRRIGTDAHVIWGGAVDPTLADELRVRLVVAGVGNERVRAGDPCPRCGATLVAYSLGTRTTISCDDCGYAGVSVRLR